MGWFRLHVWWVREEENCQRVRSDFFQGTKVADKGEVESLCDFSRQAFQLDGLDLRQITCEFCETNMSLYPLLRICYRLVDLRGRVNLSKCNRQPL